MSSNDNVLEAVIKNRMLLAQILGNQSDIAHMILHAHVRGEPEKLTELALRIVKGTQNVLELP